MRAIAAFVVVLAAFAVNLTLAPTASAGTGVSCAATGFEQLATDQADYAPGSTVHLSGAGFAGNCDVVVEVTRPDGVVETGEASTDFAGNLAYDYVLPSAPAIVGVYQVRVLGFADALLATTSFTDGNLKIYADAARTLERTTYERGDRIYGRASGLVSTSSYRFQVKDRTGTVKATSACLVGGTIDYEYQSEATSLLSDNTNWQFLLLEFAKGSAASNPSCSTGGSFPANPSTDAIAPFQLGSAFTFGTSADAANCVATPCANVKTSFKSGDTVFVKVLGYSQQNNRINTHWIRPDGTVACANTGGGDRGTPDGSGRFPDHATPANRYLQFPPGTTGPSFNLAASYNGACPALTNGEGRWQLLLDQANTQQTVQLDIFTLDLTAPTVMIDQAAGQADPATASPINFTAVFSEVVSGFTAADVTLAGTAGGTKAVTVTNPPGDGRTYNVAVSGMTSRGTVVASIAANGATDPAGNGNTASTSNDNTVTWDRAPATTTPTFNLGSPRTNDNLQASTTTSDPDGDNVSVAWIWKVTRGPNTCTVKTDSSAAATAGLRSVSLDLSQSYSTSSCSGATPPSSINPSKDDVVTVTATPHDGLVSGGSQSNNVTIANTPPSATVSLNDHSPKTNDTLIATATRTDPDGGTAESKIAVYHSDLSSFSADVIGKIRATGLYSEVADLSPYDCNSGPAPTLATLRQYAAVLVWSNCVFSEPVALGNVLADYVDAGGRVTVATFALHTSTYGIAGRFISGGYMPLTQGANTQGTRRFLVADDPGNPLLSGVASFDGGSGSWHHTGLSLTPGATLVAHWSGDNEPLVAVKGNVVGLNFFPPSSDARSDFWNASTNGVRLMTNALQPDATTVTYVWKVDGVTKKTTSGTSSSTDTFDLSQAGNGDKGQTVTVEVTPNDGSEDGSVASDSATIVNSPPVVDAASIDEAAPKTNDTLHTTVSRHDDDGDAVSLAYQWQKNTGTGWADLVGETSATLDLSKPGNGNKGDHIRFRVTPNDGTADGAAFTSAAVSVVNSPPTATNVLVSDTSPKTKDTISVSFDYADDDGDAQAGTSYQWQKKGPSDAGFADIAGATGSSLNLATAGNGDKGDQLRVLVTPRDGSAFGAGVLSNVATVVNSPPSASDLASPANGATISNNKPTFNWTDSTDADADAVTYSIQVSSGNSCDFSGTLAIAKSGLTDSEFTPDSALPDGTYCWRVKATDSDNADSAYSATRTLTIDTVKPNATMTFPLHGASYTAATWDGGCGTPAGDACGTASDTGTGVANVEFSLQRMSDGTYWNGTAWVASATPVFVTASGTTSWTYAFGSVNFPADGSYTARARSNDQAGNASDVVAATFTVNVPPKVSAGGPYSGNEGSAIQLNGSVSADAQTKSWSYTKGPDVDVGATCGFGSATSPSTTFTCTDDGTYTVTLTASDGTNPPATSSQVVSVANVVPSVKITSPSSGTTTVVGVSVAISASFADPATNDKHTCVINRGDGTSVVGTVTESGGSGKCTGSVKFPAKGTYSVSVTVTDDDLGAGTSPPITINVR
jgi:hypothetical protein